ncbi:hypothetical protein HDU81_003128 [Chytriomyces hyalinus]|nr:hypothetical protein HDU81_003128 [Chytriomyces hyalinus]
MNRKKPQQQQRKNNSSNKTNRQSKKQSDAVAAGSSSDGRRNISDIPSAGEGAANLRGPEQQQQAHSEHDRQIEQKGQDGSLDATEDMDVQTMAAVTESVEMDGFTDRSASPSSSNDTNSTSGGNSASRSSANDEDSYKEHLGTSRDMSIRSEETTELRAKMDELSSHPQQHQPHTHHQQSHEQFQPHPHLRGVALDSNTMFSKSNPSYVHAGPAFIYAQAAGIVRSHHLSYQQQSALQQKAAMQKNTPPSSTTIPVGVAQITPPISEGHSAHENNHDARSNPADPYHHHRIHNDTQTSSPPEHPTPTHQDQTQQQQHHHHHHHHHHNNHHNHKQPHNQHHQQERPSRPRLRSNSHSAVGRSLSSDSINSYPLPSYGQMQVDLHRLQFPFAVARLEQEANQSATQGGVGQHNMSPVQLINGSGPTRAFPVVHREARAPFNAPSPNPSSDGGLSNTSTLLGIQPDVLTRDGSINPALLALIDDAKKGLKKMNKTRKKLQRSASWSGESSRDSLSNSSDGEGNSSGERGRKLVVQRV